MTAWPGLCAGAAIAPLMWTTPPFSLFGDSKMGPWLGVMSDEIKVLAEWIYTPNAIPPKWDADDIKASHIVNVENVDLPARPVFKADPSNVTLVVEHGDTQGAAVRALFTAAGFEDVHTLRDLSGHERCTEGRLRG